MTNNLTGKSTADLIAQIDRDPYGDNDHAAYTAAYDELSRRADAGDRDAHNWF